MPVDAFERAFQGFRHLFFQAAKGDLIQFGGIHATGTVHQVVGFVRQHRHAPLVFRGEPVQQRGKIEVVVVVPHHHITPARHFLAQIIGADVVPQCHLAELPTIQYR